MSTPAASPRVVTLAELATHDWRNPPPQAKLVESPDKTHQLVAVTAPKTDFWSRTHYGFKVDNGHFLGVHVSAADACHVDMAVRCTFAPLSQYDQAGLMAFVDGDTWMKSSIEFESREESSRLGAVVTRGGYSDWSTMPVSHEVNSYELRFQVRGETFMAFFRLKADEEWVQIRCAHLPIKDKDVWYGVYLCSPKERGEMEATFEAFTLEVGTSE